MRLIRWCMTLGDGALIELACYGILYWCLLWAIRHW